MTTIFDHLESEWATLARGRQARTALTVWAATHPALAPFPTLQALADWMARPRGDAGWDVLAALVRCAATDPLAARTALQLLLPGLKAVCARLQVDGSREETAAVVVAAAWERLTRYPAGRDPRRVAGNVVLDALKAACRAARPAPTPLDPITLPEPTAVAATNASDELLDLLTAALDAGQLSPADAALITELRVDGVPTRDVARRARVCDGTVRRWRHRAEAKLHDAA